MGFPSYATLGYDASMADVGVAWIKFLELPDVYLQFIENHQVKNVIFLGVGENVQSELPVHLNARIGKYELEAELKQREYCYVSKRLDNVEEVWDLSDGINAPCEFVASKISKQLADSYKTKINLLSPLTMSNLHKLVNNSEGMIFTAYE